MRSALPFVLLLAACRPPDPALTSGVATLGGPGASEGRFATPRAAAWDPRGFLYVVDKTARIQKFGRDGRFLFGWTTPASDNGRPTGIAVAPDGDVLVADTHYHRILRYSPEGALRGSFGREGRCPGEFLYPTGIACLPDGTIFVSEYGGNDRVQVFSPDGRLLRGWGAYGDGPAEFKRPQSLALSSDRLYVADAANHRILVFTHDGKPVASWDGLRYPYGVSVEPGGTILVAEYGRHQVVRFSPDGRRLGAAGRAGTGPAEFNTPWAAIPIDAARVAVVDAGNHRVQLWPASRLAGGSP
jgi:sugar lactone lactonase YvrE